MSISSPFSAYISIFSIPSSLTLTDKWKLKVTESIYTKKDYVEWDDHEKDEKDRKIDINIDRYRYR